VSGNNRTSNRVDEEIDRVIEHTRTYGERLVGLRLHHQLTLLQLEGYKHLAVELAYRQ
jgi:hypothetical protein